MTAADLSRRHIVPLVSAPLACYVLLSSGTAMAHAGIGVEGGFLSGAWHPVSGPDHMLAMVAVGIWGAFLGRPLIFALPVVFPALMAAGGILAIEGLPLPPVEIGVSLSVVLLGAMITGAVRAPSWLALIMVGLFGLFHGYAHGVALPEARDPAAYSLGFIVATGALHLAGIAVGEVRRVTYGARLLQCAGAIIMVCGVYFFAQAIRL